jgi:hypothetical protein
MRTVRSITIAGTGSILGLCVLGSCFQSGSTPRRPPVAVAARARSAAELALWQAARFRTRAKLATSEERGAVEEWDPKASEELDADEWRLQQLSMDRQGDLARARQWAERASRLATTPPDKYRVAEFQVLLDHEMGDHESELRRAHTLLALAPGSSRARMVLRRAETCHRMRGLPGPERLRLLYGNSARISIRATSAPSRNTGTASAAP